MVLVIFVAIIVGAGMISDGLSSTDDYVSVSSIPASDIESGSHLVLPAGDYMIVQEWTVYSRSSSGAESEKRKLFGIAFRDGNGEFATCLVSVNASEDVLTVLEGDTNNNTVDLYVSASTSSGLESDALSEYQSDLESYGISSESVEQILDFRGTTLEDASSSNGSMLVFGVLMALSGLVLLVVLIRRKVQGRRSQQN